jgi:hypothetical protein
VAIVAAVAAVVAGGASPAVADGVQLDAPPADDADDHAAVQAAFGAGSDGGAVAMADLRAEWTGSGLALGLGGRVRWRDGELVREDWDALGDWLGVVRRLELAHHGERMAGAVGVGRLAPVAVASVVDQYTSSALVDRRAPGAVGRLRGEHSGVDVVVDDVTAPTLVAAGVSIGLSDRWRFVAALAADPAADRGDERMRVAATGQGELGARYGERWLGAGASIVAARDGSVAAVVRADASGRRGRWIGSAVIEARGFDGAAAAAPYGPLWPVEREARMPASDAGAAGAALAIVTRGEVEGVGVVEAGLRTRGPRGDVITLRVALPWWRVVQAGAYAAIGEDAALVAGEARVVWAPRWFSSVEVGHGYRRDEAGALAPVWQLSAWFGAAAGW